MANLNSVDDVCALVGDCVIWAADDTPVAITPDTELLLMGLLDSLAIRRIIAELADAGVVLPADKIVAATFRSPAALWQAVTEVRT